MEEINLKELLSYFIKKLWLILIVLVLVVGVGELYTNKYKVPLYSSETTIILVKGTTSKKNETTTVTQSDISLNQNLVATYSQVIKSRRVLEQVIANLDLPYTYKELSKNITVSSVNDTEIIKITVNDTEALRAKEIANRVASIFKKEIVSIYNIENISVVDVAVENDEVININVTKETVIYVAAGLVLGFGIIFVMFYFDTSIKSADVIEEKFNLPVLGDLPRLKKGRKKDGRNRSRKESKFVI